MCIIPRCLAAALKGILIVLTRSFIDRGMVCGPVNVLFQSNGKSLKLGQIKLGDMQVLISLSFMLY